MTDRRGFLNHALGVPVVAATAIRDGDLSKPALFGITVGHWIFPERAREMREVLRPYEEEFNCKFIIFQPGATITKVTEAA